MAAIMFAMRAIVLLGLVGLLLSAPAAVAGELVRPTPGDGIATCLRATGSADGLAVVGPQGRRGFATELVGVSPAALQPTGSVTLGHLDECGSAAVAGGSAVVAGVVRTGSDSRVQATVRDPGGGFAAPAVLRHATVVKLATAVSPRGDAAVAWMERRGSLADLFDRQPIRLLVALRPPGGRFGVPREVFGWSNADIAQSMALVAAFGAGGTLTLAWTRPRPDRGRVRDLSDVAAVSVGPGAAIGAPQALGRDRQEVRRIALSVAPDGRALLAFVSTGKVEIFERGPAGSAFVAGGTVTDPRPGTVHFPSDVAVALYGEGAAVIGWREETFRGRQSRPDETVWARTRGVGGSFGAPRVVDAASSEVRNDGLTIFGGASGPPIDRDAHALEVAVNADGRVAMAWTRRGRGGSHEVRAATIAPDGAVAVRTLGSPCRRASGVAALLAGGVPSVAFTDNRQARWGELPESGGALHVVTADDLLAPRTTSPAPVAHVRLTGSRRLRYGQKLAVPVVCDRDCDVLVQAGSDPPRAQLTPEAGISARAGVARRAVMNPESLTLVSRKAHGVPLRVTACAPDGTSSTVTTTVQPAVQVPPRPGPVPRDVRARRSGRSIVVTWSIARALRRISFDVVGAGAESAVVDPRAIAIVGGRLRTHFRVVLHPRHPEAITKVTVGGRTNEPPYRGGMRTVRVR